MWCGSFLTASTLSSWSWDLDSVLGLYAALQRRLPEGVVDLVPAARTLLIVVEGDAHLPSVTAAVRGTRPVRVRASVKKVVEVPVTYAGEDLEEVARLYPRSSPGGWHLLGRTDLVLFDVEREPPALLAPTTRVQFRALAP